MVDVVQSSEFESLEQNVPESDAVVVAEARYNHQDAGEDRIARERAAMGEFRFDLCRLLYSELVEDLDGPSDAVGMVED